MSNNYYKEMVRLADSIADKAHEGRLTVTAGPISPTLAVWLLGYVSLRVSWLPRLTLISLWRS